MSKSRTIVEVLIIVPLGLAAIAFIVYAGLLRDSTKARAEEAARTYVTQMFDDWNGKLVCVDDNDSGYVSCTVGRKDKAPVGIECAITWAGTKGCRLQRSP